MSAVNEGLRKAILTPRPLPFEDVVVPAWDGQTVRVQGLTAAEQDDFEGSTVQVNDGVVRANRDNFTARLLVRCLRDPATGDRLFTDDEAALLGHQSQVTLAPLFRIAVRLNGMDAKRAVEAAQGN